MRLKSAWKDALSEERLLILSVFGKHHRRSTAALANQRNTFVAALADKICIAHAAEDSKILKFAQMVLAWGKLVLPLTHQQITRFLNSACRLSGVSGHRSI